jgi:plastocyanin
MLKRTIALRAIPAVVAVAVLVAACGSDGSDQAGGGTSGDVAATSEPSTVPDGTDAPAPGAVEANGETVDVVALDNTFRPETIEVVAGTAIRWENRGRNDHDVVPADDSLDWGVGATDFAPGDEYTVLFDTPGEYPYYCSIHGTKDVGMIGTVVVTLDG